MAETAPKTDNPEPRPGQTVRVLIVDDDADVCEYLELLLSKEGYETASVTDPKKAVETLKAGNFHLVILDLMMPGMDGTQVLQEIRKVDDDVAVIIFTGYPSVDTAISSLQHQASDYLKKPFRLHEFKEAVKRTLQRKGLVVDPESELHKTIGGKVRELRKGQSLTLKQLSRRSGLSVSLLSQIERAESSASVASLLKIATALRVRITDLFDGK